jgi:hypothetical protein
MDQLVPQPSMGLIPCEALAIPQLACYTLNATTGIASNIHDTLAPLTQLIWCIPHVENRPVSLLSHSLVLEHSGVDARILAFNLQPRLRREGIEDEVVVAVRAVLITVLELTAVFAEALLALLAGEGLRRWLTACGVK